MDELNQLEAEKAMPYVSSAERISMKRGLEEGLKTGRQEGRQVGLQEGRQVGLQEGVRLGLASLLLAQLSQRFGQIPSWASEKLKSAPTETLENWGRRVLDADSIEKVFG